MAWQEPRVTLEIYELELDSLVRVVQMDCDGDAQIVNAVVFSPAGDRLSMSPAELLRRGLNVEAYEAARVNFMKLRQQEPAQLMRSAKLHQRRGRGPSRAS